MAPSWVIQALLLFYNINTNDAPLRNTLRNRSASAPLFRLNNSNRNSYPHYFRFDNSQQSTPSLLRIFRSRWLRNVEQLHKLRHLRRSVKFSNSGILAVPTAFGLIFHHDKAEVVAA
ncbi:hypothetical protein B0J14DRAFT_557744 [Halenospora varia]|nr:hypothetical protein B0J14DRAFT_557744 [Halenospora varia]